jgi:hypothetical protein
MAMVVMVIVQTAFWNRDRINVDVTITKSAPHGQARAKYPPMTSVLVRPVHFALCDAGALAHDLRRRAT